MKNESGIIPVGRAVLIAPYEPELHTGLIQIPDSVKGSMQMVEQRAVVVEVGGCAWDDEKTPRATAGDKVLVTKYAGYMAVGPQDGKQYRLVNDRDIFAKLSGDL